MNTLPLEMPSVLDVKDGHSRFIKKSVENIRVLDMYIQRHML